MQKQINIREDEEVVKRMKELFPGQSYHGYTILARRYMVARFRELQALKNHFSYNDLVLLKKILADVEFTDEQYSSSYLLSVLFEEKAREKSLEMPETLMESIRELSPAQSWIFFEKLKAEIKK